MRAFAERVADQRQALLAARDRASEAARRAARALVERFAPARIPLIGP